MLTAGVLLEARVHHRVLVALALDGQLQHLLHRQLVGRVEERQVGEGMAGLLLGRLLDVGQVRAPPAGLARLLEERVVHHLTAARLRETAQQLVLQLGVGAAAALDDTGAGLAQHVGQREQLGLRRAGGRDASTGHVEVVHVARDRQSERAGLERLAHQAAHRFQLLGLRLALGARLAHGVEPHRGVTDQRADVDAEPAAYRLHVLREALPRPRHAGLQDVHRDRLDVGQHAGQLLALVLLHRRQRQRAVADDDGGGAVVAGERAQRVPQHLGVVVAVVVHEPRGDHTAVGLDHAPRRAVEPSELGDLAPHHADIAVEARPTGAIDDATVLDQEVKGHDMSSSSGCGRGRLYSQLGSLSCRAGGEGSRGV